MAEVLRLDDDLESWTTMEALENDRRRRPIHSITGVTFCGCGFLGVYLVGAASFLQEHTPALLEGRLGGSSVGSLLAVALACGLPLQHIRQRLLDTARDAHQKFLGTLNPSFSLDTPLLAALLDLLPEDAHERCSGRVFLSLTRAKGLSNEIVSEFRSRDELVQAISCCCFVPVLSGLYAPSFKGSVYVDGGMSNNIPLKGPDTLSVHALSGDFDICPDDTSTAVPLMASVFNQRLVLSVANARRFKQGLAPPPPEELDKYYFQGYNDARDCLVRSFRL